MEGSNWEISVTSPTRLEVDPQLSQAARLTPRPEADEALSGSTLNMDDCWTINIKAPASLLVEKGPPTEDGYQETVISENEEERGSFLAGPEWKVRITTKAGQELDVKQVEEGGEHRVLISPVPPKVEEVKVEKKVEKKAVVKVEIKKGDNRSLYSGGKIFFRECPLYHKTGWHNVTAYRSLIKSN